MWPADLSKNSFLLTKWYLDCVAENGDAAILYVADLRWKNLSVHYGSALTVLSSKISSTSSLHGSPAPVIEDPVIRLSLPELKLEGRWSALRPSVRRIVFEDAHESVDWHCVQPMSQADISLPGDTRITGLGYVECLTLSLPPWQLPLISLNWGRYLSQQDALVWIDWRGQGSNDWKMVIHNSKEQSVSSITESEVVLADMDARLELDRGLILRQGQLGDTVLPGISRLARLLPRSILSVKECKWRSRGRFRTGASESSGWAIHEVVQWKD